MCGIIGYNTVARLSNIDKKYISLLTKNLMVESASRGTDATGYLAHFSKTHKSVFYKQPVPSTQFIQNGALNFKQFPDKFIGHTRQATSGSPMYNRNNHPLIRKDFGLVHNGIVYQWDTNTKYESLRKHMLSQTDSELFAVYLERHGGSFKKIPHLFGTSDYVLVTLNFETGAIKIARDSSRPLCYTDLSKSLGIIVFASTSTILRSALQATFQDFPEFIVQEIEPYVVHEFNGSKLVKAYNMTKPATKNSDAHWSNTVDNWEANVINRVENDVWELFQTKVGERDYMYHLRKFATLYYLTGSGWVDRDKQITLKLAQEFIDRSVTVDFDNH